MFAEALVCLALNVYHEARDQPFIGQVAVAQVVMNRVRDDRYPDNVCDVVKQGPTYAWKQDFPVRHRCQFSWYCDGKSDKTHDTAAWDKAMTIAQGVHTATLMTLLRVRHTTTQPMSCLSGQTARHLLYK
jgi:N-acetylmuramoyl-L-alanine amidase